jgi:hypothetical protein
MGLADSGIMPPMKCWEIVADKLQCCWLVLGLLQRGDKRWLALDR